MSYTAGNSHPFRLTRAKGAMYDPGIRVPRLAWRPGRFSPAVSGELIAHVDLPSTFLELAGLESAAKMQGRSFLPLLENRAYTPRTEVFSERNWHDNFDPQCCIRTGKWKPIFNAAPNFPYRPAWNLADSPSWASIQQLMRTGGLSLGQRTMLAPSRPVLELYDLETDPTSSTTALTIPPAALSRWTSRPASAAGWPSRTTTFPRPTLRAALGPRRCRSAASFVCVKVSETFDHAVSHHGKAFSDHAAEERPRRASDCVTKR